MNKFINLVKREIKLFSTNIVAVAIFILAPIIYALLIGFVYKDAKITDLPIVVVDEDQTPISDKIIDALSDNQYIEVEKVLYSKTGVNDIVIKDNYIAVVSIPDDFEADILQKKHPEIDIDINGANMLTGNYASTGIYNVLATLNAGFEIESSKKQGLTSEYAEEAFETFKINNTRFYNPSSNYLFFLWPGMLGTIMQQVFLLALAVIFAREFEEKTFGNLLNQTKSAAYILFVKTFTYWTIGALLWFPLIRIFFPLFNVPLVEAKFAYWLISALFISSLTFLGFAISVIFKSQLKATEILMIVAAPSFIISGQTWPLSQMPDWVQFISKGIPLTHYLNAQRKLMMYKSGIENIAPEITYLAAISIISLIGCYIVLRIKIKRELKQQSV